MSSTTIFTIPHCYLPSSKKQVIDMADCLRTEYQIQQLVDISKRDDFAYFVTCQDGGQSWIIFPEFDDDFTVMWYAKDGTCHTSVIHSDRVSHIRVLGNSAPVPVDHVVYTSRCE